MPELDNTNKDQAKTLSLVIKDLAVLHAAYMPFVIGGGIFVPTRKQFAFGDRLAMIVTLIDETAKFQVEGKVVWITPETSQDRTPGVGLQLSGGDAGSLCKKIEVLLSTYPHNNTPNNTM